MALLEDIAKSTTPGGLAVGIGALLLAPMVVPAAGRMLRPAAKAVLRTGITAWRSTMEPLTAAISELVTEAQLELAGQSGGAVAAGEAGGAKSHRARARGTQDRS